MPSDAVEHWKRNGVILPGHQTEIARWIANHNGDDDE